MADGARSMPGANSILEDDGDLINKEQEVAMAQLEDRLRVMVIDVMKPTVKRVSVLQHEFEELRKRLVTDEDKIAQIFDSAKIARHCHDMLEVYKERLSDFWDKVLDQERASMEASNRIMRQVEAVESTCEAQGSVCQRLRDALSRVTLEMEQVHGHFSDLQAQVDSRLYRNQEHTDAEIKRIDATIQDLRDAQLRYVNEIWGAEENGDSSPLCLRRLDVQIRRNGGLLEETMTSLTELLRLDPEMKTLATQQESLDSQVKSLSNLTVQLTDRISRIAEESKKEYKRASNMMAAFTANLMQDMRISFGHDIKAVQQMRHDVDVFVQETQGGMDKLQENVLSNTQHVEAVLREVRLDVENYEQRRLKDKQTLEDGLHGLQDRVGSAFESSEATFKGLEHISSVIGMTLQSDRMSVALDLQDFVERKDTPYVGVRGTSARDRVRGAKSADCTRRGGIDPEHLMRLFYKPQPVTFLGTAFERPHLLALREKLLHTAQQELQQGPSQRPNKQHKMFADECNLDAPQTPIVPQAVGMQAHDITPPVMKRPLSQGARPGSRGQPSARGSPLTHMADNGADSVTTFGPTPSTPFRASTTTPAKVPVALDMMSNGMHLPSIGCPDGRNLVTPVPATGQG